MAVNGPSPRAKPEDKVCLPCHKSLASSTIMFYLLTAVFAMIVVFF